MSNGCFGNVDQTGQTGNPSQRLRVASVVSEWSTSAGIDDLGREGGSRSPPPSLHKMGLFAWGVS